MTAGDKPKKPRKSRRTPIASSTTPEAEAAPEAPIATESEEMAAEPTPPPPPPLDEERPKRASTVKPLLETMMSPEWPLDSSEAEFAKIPEPVAAPPPPQQQQQVAMPDPKAAALEAARIVGEIVGDIESAGGAAIVAAAAAGAAIEAARARSRAAAEGADVTNNPPPAELVAPEGNPYDPKVTVRMARDRILRALAEDVAAQAEAQAGQPPSENRAPSQPGRAPSHPGRAPTNPPQNRNSSQAIPRPAEGSPAGAQPDAAVPDEGDEEFDPVQIASAAISRLRQRAATDLAELKTHYHRHDIFVLLLAFVIIVVAGRVHRGLVTPPTTAFSERGLVFEHSKTWLQPEPVTPYSPRIVHELGATTAKPAAVYHVAFTSSLDASARMEVLIDKKPAWSNIVTGLELERRTRWGELYTLDDSSVESIAGHDWLRTAFRYAHVAEKGDVPRVDSAVEYATIDRDQIYVITLYGSPRELDRIEGVVAPSLRVPTQTGLPLVPQTRTLSQRTYPNAVARAFDSTVMVVAADLVDGRLRPRGGGSGVVVGADGSILTNYHVIHDKDGRLHDVFVIGRFSQPDHAPQLWCAGRPSRSKLQREIDLALIKCDLDLDGRLWNPRNGTLWATLPEARTADVKMGQRLWVLGYPDVGGGGLTLSEGQVEGWTGEDGAAGKDFIKTDASITHGNSGGPVVDDHGRLVGIAAAYRTRTTPAGGLVESSQIGLVRPLSTANCLLATATVGWSPRENHTECIFEPSAVEAPAEGIRLSSKVLDAASEAPVRDALVMILRKGVKANQVDVNRLDDQVLSWGRSNAQGEVQLKQPVPVPGTYTVMVVSKGYEPLIGENELHLDANTPPFFDPWGKIWLRSR
ncbi:MAG: trypsin-like peptidase domain-containing protein [Deltaproteobacteria bacterium]|nr:trypsin-like peptidase domain-containing protein [Deltaproteobacteria bacterium]